MDSPPAARSSDDSAWLILRWSVVALAVLSRLWWLDVRPPHFDEGVNGWFTDQMRHLGCYQYDPGNYHGPLHFYVLYFFKSLLGRNLWALRLPTAIVGIVTVEWCFRFERFLGRRASLWAAVAMLVSPAVLYFQRDAIHEAWQLFFLVLGFWGICGLCQEGAKKHLWATGMALAGMILTKETYIIHLACLFLAGVCVFFAELLQPSRQTFLRPEPDLPHAPPRSDENATTASDAPPPLPSWITLREDDGLFERFRDAFPRQQWSPFDLLAVVGTVMALILFFYSGNGLHWKGVEGLVTAYSDTRWGKKADDGEGHAKMFMYWSQLIVRNEPWALLGLLAAAVYAVPGMARAWFRGRCGAIAVALFCVAFVVFANAWDPVLFSTPPKPPLPVPPNALRADHVWWWVAAGLIAVVGSVCAALPPLSERTLRSCGAMAVAACIAALCLPHVYPEPHLFTFVLIGLAFAISSLALPAPGDWRVRLVSIYGIGTLVAFSIIRYKTPWCIISLLWPFFFTGGAALAEITTLGRAAGREAATFLGAVAAAVSTTFAWDLNYCRPTDENFHQRPGENFSYVYVQSLDDVWTVTNFLLDEVRANRTFLQQDGVILCDSTYPLPWLLGDFTHIGYYNNGNAPASPDGYRVDFLLVTDKRVDEVEACLNDTYYKQPVRLRPALEELQLYLRASRFAHQMPAEREPEFHPVPEPPAVPATAPNAMPLLQPPAADEKEGE